MPSSEEFSSPEVVDGESLSRAPVLRRQNADEVHNQLKSEYLNTRRDTHRGRLQKLGFGLSSGLAVDGSNPRVEWTKFFSNTWNTKAEFDVVQGHQSTDLSSDNSSADDSGALFARPSQWRTVPSATRALGTASIERKYSTPPFKNVENSLLVTKLRVKVGSTDFATPDTASSSKSTPPYVDPRILMRRKMMMRPSLAKQLADTEQKDAQAEIVQNQAELVQAAARAAETRAKNMKILSYRRKIMMRPSKVKQITEMESNMRILEAAISQIRSEKMALLSAEKKAENARLLAVRRQMMQRPSKYMQVPAIQAAITQKQAHQNAHVDASTVFDSSLHELLEHFAAGLKNGLIKADELVSKLEPTKARAVYQSPLRVMNASEAAISQNSTD